MAKIGFIGVGNMGFPMLTGVKKFVSSDEIVINTKRLEHMKEIAETTGVAYLPNKCDLVKQSKYIVMTVKPQFYSEVLNEIKSAITESNIIITVAPGITIQNVKDIVGNHVKVVRSMPNTPALVGEGMTGVCFDSADQYTEEEKEFIANFFESFGKYEVVPESLMDAVVCANGSSPAYVYMFIESLADSVVKYGIPRDKAYTLVAQTVLGSAKMVLETKEHPGLLKDKVCSPGGTTIAGVAALEENGFRNAVIKATDACYNKATSFKK